jgi:hypothetical protein
MNPDTGLLVRQGEKAMLPVTDVQQMGYRVTHFISFHDSLACRW